MLNIFCTLHIIIIIIIIIIIRMAISGHAAHKREGRYMVGAH
jgi:hypothetical protein